MKTTKKELWCTAEDGTRFDLIAVVNSAVASALKANQDLSSHTGNKNNPHSVTKTQVGLSEVVNERQYSANNKPTWDDVTDKPTSFNPASHNHDSAYSKLNHTHSYAASDHNHNGVYAPVHDHPYAGIGHTHYLEYEDITSSAKEYGYDTLYRFSNRICLGIKNNWQAFYIGDLGTDEGETGVYLEIDRNGALTISTI